MLVVMLAEVARFRTQSALRLSHAQKPLPSTSHPLSTLSFSSPSSSSPWEPQSAAWTYTIEGAACTQEVRVMLPQRVHYAVPQTEDP